MMRDFMAEALALAREAAAEGEVPVGCVIERGGIIIGRGRNRRERERNALGHAELEAIAEACRTLHAWRLTDCRLFVTLEPCPMCAGAIWNARIPTVVYGAPDPKAGACGTVDNLFRGQFAPAPTVYGGVMEPECAALLTDFFRSLRPEAENTDTERNPNDE